jgi:hypothetical protein
VVWFDGSSLGDGPPAIQYFFNSPFNIFLNYEVLSRLTSNAFEFADSFENSKLKFPSSYWLKHFSD